MVTETVVDVCGPWLHPPYGCGDDHSEENRQHGHHDNESIVLLHMLLPKNLGKNPQTHVQSSSLRLVNPNN